MTQETTQETFTATDDTVHNQQNVLCRVTDVNKSIQTSFQRFLQTESKTLEDLANFIGEEMSKMELFVPSTTLQTEESVELAGSSATA